MWMNSGSWADSLLRRFLPVPTGYSQDTPTQIIRYDLDDEITSSAVEQQRITENVKLYGSSVDEISEPDEKFPNGYYNTGTSVDGRVPLSPPLRKDNHIPVHSYQRQKSNRPTSLSPPRHHQPLSSLRRPLEVGNFSTNSIRRLPKKRPRDPEKEQISPVAQQYDHNQNVLALNSPAVKSQTTPKNTTQQNSKQQDSDSPHTSAGLRGGNPSFQETLKEQCNPNEAKPRLCYKLSLPSKLVIRGGQIVQEPRRRRSSTDEGFGFLTPAKQSQIVKIRQSWESGSISSSDQSNKSVYVHNTRKVYTKIVRTTLKKSPSLQTFNAGVKETEQSVERPRRASVSGSLRPLLSKFQVEPEEPQVPDSKVSDFVDVNQTDVMDRDEEDIVSKMSEKVILHEETISYINQHSQELSKDASVSERREWYERESELYGYKDDYDGIIRKFVAPSIKFKEGIPVDIIKPKKLPQVPTIVIYFHGGDLTTGSRKSCDSLCKYLAVKATCIVVNAEYRLAPEHKFPAQLDDANCVVRWVKMNRGLLGAVLESKIGIVGESFGGLIAASVCPHVMHIDFQILIYPVLDLSLSQPSVKEFEKGPGITRKDIERVVVQTLSNPEERCKPKASPLHYPDFTRHPRTFLIIAQADPFRDAVYEYRQKLIEAEVPVSSYLVKGAMHSFFRLPGHFKGLCEESLTQIIDFLNKLVLL